MSNRTLSKPGSHLKLAPHPSDNCMNQPPTPNHVLSAMYASPFGSPFSSARNSAGAYASVGVQTGVAGATPHRLVAMLFDGFVDSVAQAKGAMRAGQIEPKGRAVSRAARIIEEGLKAALNLTEGGSLAADLNDLYAYVTLRLTYANRHNDEAALDECLRLMQPLRDAWASIAPHADR